MAIFPHFPDTMFAKAKYVDFYLKSIMWKQINERELGWPIFETMNGELWWSAAPILRDLSVKHIPMSLI